MTKWSNILIGDRLEVQFVWNKTWGIQEFSDVPPEVLFSLNSLMTQNGSLIVGDTEREMDDYRTRATSDPVDTARDLFFLGRIRASLESYYQIPIKNWEVDVLDSDFYFDLILGSHVWSLYWNSSKGIIERVWENPEPIEI